MKLFRQKRAASLEQSNAAAYWKYAIGEVVFVVVGILMAFQIDTWSERRSAKEHTHYLFAQVQDELALNIKNCNLVLEQYGGKDSELGTDLGHLEMAPSVLMGQLHLL